MIELTRNELAVLEHASLGKNVYHSANTLHYSYSYIRLLRVQAMNKLQARNINHAVAIAIRRGYIV